MVLHGKEAWMDAPEHGHVPVLVDAVLELLAPQPGAIVVDCTLGRGGHAAELVRRVVPGGQLLGLDVDPVNITYARQRLGPLAESCRFFHANFAELPEVLAEAGAPRVDAVLADLGVSTNQLLAGGRGLSFSGDEPLDMRLDPRLKESAADLVARLPERELADLLYKYADERFSFRIARKITQVRGLEPIRTTGQLARLVRAVVPAGRHRAGQIDPATRTFQALRIAVNDELGHLEKFLNLMPDVMKPGGRLAVISFHSGEDRIVKHTFREWSQTDRCELLTKKPREPDEAEQRANPRSRSAKLRAVRFI
jgi:16S rRNA (cytosine1402-N4)-methyltransferase